MFAVEHGPYGFSGPYIWPFARGKQALFESSAALDNTDALTALVAVFGQLTLLASVIGL